MPRARCQRVSANIVNASLTHSALAPTMLPAQPSSVFEGGLTPSSGGLRSRGRRQQLHKHVAYNPKWHTTPKQYAIRHIHLDETGFNLYTWRTYGLAPVGERINRVMAFQHGSITFLVAVTPDVGVLQHETFEPGVTMETWPCS